MLGDSSSELKQAVYRVLSCTFPGDSHRVGHVVLKSFSL